MPGQWRVVPVSSLALAIANPHRLPAVPLLCEPPGAHRTTRACPRTRVPISASQVSSIAGSMTRYPALRGVALAIGTRKDRQCVSGRDYRRVTDSKESAEADPNEQGNDDIETTPQPLQPDYTATPPRPNQAPKTH